MHAHSRSTTFGALLCLALTLVCAAESHAQTIGTFRWQLQPYCNVLTLTVTQTGAVFTLDGFDDQCGAAERASIVGAAVFNPDGSVNLGLTSVLAPSGAPVHLDAKIDVAMLSGSWRDSAGNDGTFVLTPGPGLGGMARPIGSANIAPSSITSTHIAPNAIGAAQTNLSEIQARVTGDCPPGQHIGAIGPSGAVQCTFAPETLFQRAAFEFVSVPPIGQAPSQLATLTFTPLVSGTALLRGRGYCNMGPLSGSSNVINIAAGITAASAFNPAAYSDWGIVRVPNGSVAGLHQHGWTSESRLANVMAGSTYTVGLFGRHEDGNTTSNCTGSFTVQLFTSTLP